MAHVSDAGGWGRGGIWGTHIKASIGFVMIIISNGKVYPFIGSSREYIDIDTAWNDGDVKGNVNVWYILLNKSAT